MSSVNESVETSEWQKKIEGEWHGIPGLFDAQATTSLRVDRPRQ